MALLAAKLYDPAAAVSKATTAAIGMTAFDTTNLRHVVTTPANGIIGVSIMCAIHGAATCPQILLGVLDGATVRGRIAPEITVSNLATTSIYVAKAEFLITGLTGGASITLDAAYGVETLVASTNIKYGGPNGTTANDAFGGFRYELYSIA